MPPATVPVLRAAQAADIPRIIALSAQLGYPIDAANVADHLRRIAQQSEQLLLVAEPHGEIAGWVAAAVHRILVVPPYVEIEGLVVDQAIRQRGVGRALLAAAETWAAHLGMRTVRLRSNITREAAHAFYARCGYVVTKTSYSFLKTLDGSASLGEGIHKAPQ